MCDRYARCYLLLFAPPVCGLSRLLAELLVLLLQLSTLAKQHRALGLIGKQRRRGTSQHRRC